MIFLHSPISQNGAKRRVNKLAIHLPDPNSKRNFPFDAWEQAPRFPMLSFKTFDVLIAIPGDGSFMRANDQSIIIQEKMATLNLSSGVYRGTGHTIQNQ